jgi:hypothetical protein
VGRRLDAGGLPAEDSRDGLTAGFESGGEDVVFGGAGLELAEGLGATSGDNTGAGAGFDAILPCKT